MREPHAPSARTEPASRRSADFDLLRHNLGMASALEDFIAPAFGPGGRGKLFLDEKGAPIPTTDGARMLTALNSSHPVAKLVAGAAEAQDQEWQDGTKVTALLALRLLRRAEPLLDQGLRPARIIRGFEIGLQMATEEAVRIAVGRDPQDEVFLRDIARASLGGWVDPRPREELARAVVAAARQVAHPVADGWRCDRRDIHIFGKTGGGFAVEMIEGYILDRSRDDPNMPRRIEGARIALFDAAPIRGKAGIHEPRLRWIGESKVMLKRPSELEDYAAFNEKYTEDIVAALERAGASVVLCRLGISDYGHKLLARAGILGIRRIMKTKYMEAVARATGASLIKDFKEVLPEQLGRAGLVEERRLGDSTSVVISHCSNPRVATLLLLGPGAAAVDQYMALARKAVGSVASAIEDPRVVVGGSGVEIAAARHVRRESDTVDGREQLAVRAFADGLEDLSRCLAANLGLNPLDALVELRRRHSESPGWGLAAGAAIPMEMEHGAPLDSLAPRLGAWRRSVDTCRTVLRVDDFHKANRRREQEPVEPPEPERREED